MSESDTHVIEQYVDAATEGDLDAIVELTHPDCVISEPDSLPYGGEYTGKAAFQELFADVLETWEVFDFEPSEMVSEGDTTLVIFDVHVETASGESKQAQAAELYRVEDDLIRRLDVFYDDTAKLVELLE
jgi:ketosteroid isomerase-like protein